MKFRKYPSWKYFYPKIAFLPGSTQKVNKGPYFYFFFGPVVMVSLFEGFLLLQKKIKESYFIKKKVRMFF